MERKFKLTNRKWILMNINLFILPEAMGVNTFNMSICLTMSLTLWSTQPLRSTTLHKCVIFFVLFALWKSMVFSFMNHDTRWTFNLIQSLFIYPVHFINVENCAIDGGISF